MKEDFFGIILHLGKIEFKIPGEIVYSLIIMIILTIIAFFVGNAFKNADHKKSQGLFLSTIDSAVDQFYSYLNTTLGEDNSNWVTYLMSLFLLMAFVNTAGFWGIRPPSSNINFAMTLALMSVVIYNYVGLKKLKWKYFSTFTGPVDSIGMKMFLTPFEVLSHLARPVTLTMRMYGNIVAGTVMIELVVEAFGAIFHGVSEYFSFIVLSPALNPYFDLFDGILQSFVFILLTGIYIKEATNTSH